MASRRAVGRDGGKRRLSFEGEVAVDEHQAGSPVRMQIPCHFFSLSRSISPSLSLWSPKVEMSPLSLDVRKLVWIVLEL